MHRINITNRWLPYAMILPTFILICVFKIYPIFNTVFKSFQDGSGHLSIENYSNLFSDKTFTNSLWVTLKFNLIIIPVQVVIALVMALLVNLKISGVKVFRTIFYLPFCISLSIATVIWDILLNINNGFVNSFLSVFGIPKIGFLIDKRYALLSIIFICSWRGCAYWMMFFLAGLKGIGRDIYEASLVDGAGFWKRLFRITIPLLKNTILFILVANTTANFLLFAPVQITTEGGPQGSTNVLMYEAYKSAFVYSNQRRESAIVSIVLLIIMGICIIQQVTLRRNDDMKNSRIIARNIIIYIVFIVMAFVSLFPILYCVSASLRTPQNLTESMLPFTIWSVIPNKITLENYIIIFTKFDFWRPMMNTLIVTIFTIIFGCILNALAAFAFTCFEFKGRKLFFALNMISFMVPFEAIAIPLYSVADGLNMIDTYAGMIIPAVADGLVIYLFIQFFKEMPISLIEAARVDGASWLKIFFGVVMPISVSVFATAALMIFMSQWNSYMWPLLVARSKDIRTIQLAISAFKGDRSVKWTYIYAASTISAAIRLLCLFLFKSIM